MKVCTARVQVCVFSHIGILVSVFLCWLFRSALIALTMCFLPVYSGASGPCWGELCNSNHLTSGKDVPSNVSYSCLEVREPQYG